MVVRQILDTIKQIGSTESDVIQVALKSLATILRDGPSVQVKEKEGDASKAFRTGLSKISCPLSHYIKPQYQSEAGSYPINSHSHATTDVTKNSSSSS